MRKTKRTVKINAMITPETLERVLQLAQQRRMAEQGQATISDTVNHIIVSFFEQGYALVPMRNAAEQAPKSAR